MFDPRAMFKQAAELQKNLSRMEEELQKLEVVGTSGGGMVTATVNGQGLLKSIKLDASTVDPKDVEMLEDLILAAVADAQRRAQASAKTEAEKLTGGLSLPF